MTRRKKVEDTKPEALPGSFRLESDIIMAYYSSSNGIRLHERRRRSNFAFLAIGTFLGFFFSSLIAFSTVESGLRVTNDMVISGKRKMLQNSQGLQVSGWSQVHIFVGDSADSIIEASTIPKAYFEKSQWFSQVRQDEIVARLLHQKTNGYFVDLAANDAIRISNTYALERNLGWTGLCIEPNPIYWAGLVQRPCTVIGAVVGKSRGERVQFRFPRDKAPKGGIVGENFDNKEGKSDEIQTRFTTTLGEIFDRFNAPPIIDYLSLDVEGAEVLVMEAFPFDRYKIRVITVERPTPALETLLTQNDYVFVKRLKQWGELLWVHKSVERKIERSALEIDSES